MLSQELQAVVKQLELVSKKLVSGGLQSEAKTAIRGSGFEFHQLRDYIQGDDIRYIDWKASARSNKMLVRQYLEDRNRTIYLLIDVSASTFYGTSGLKSTLIKELATVLAFISFYKKDAVGLILATNEVEKIVLPGQSRAQLIALIDTLYTYKPVGKQTSIDKMLEYTGRIKNKGALICLISDFLQEFDGRLMAAAARRHDIIAFRCLDQREREFPYVGSLMFEDSETGEQRELYDSTFIVDELMGWHKNQKDLMITSRVDCLDIEVGKPYTTSLSRFLRQRVYG